MEIKVEGKNKKYANYLEECFSGEDSDLSTFLLFKYEYIFYSKSDYSFASNMNKMSNDSLLHMEILGRLITLLGEKPIIIPNENIKNYFMTDKRVLLEINIRLIKQKIILYTRILNKIEDFYIKEILKKFIIEERKNLKILEILQLKDKIAK